MPPEVTVHVNRGSADSLEAAVDTVEIRESFDLCLTGHDSPAHVHCRLGGDLARIATLPTSNYYVEPAGETLVPIEVAADAIDAPVEGELEVVTGYGAESLSIPVVVRPAPAAVEVDESLAKPRGAESASASTPLDRAIAATGLEPATAAVLALGIVAVAVATLTAATFGGPVAMAGLGIVAVGVVVALVLLVR